MTHSVSLVIENELTPSRFAEVGRPAGAYGRDDVVALVSDFDQLFWPARALYEGHQLRHRISLYTRDLSTRLGVFDGARYPINDLAFHPSKPVIAIATGKYDGGWFFEGELLLWNWETSQRVKVLSENREISRVRFVAPDALALLLRPRDDWEHEEGTFLGGTLNDLRSFQNLGLHEGNADPRIEAFGPVDPPSLQFDRGEFRQEHHEQHWNEVLAGAKFEARHRVWDVAWGRQGIFAVHDRCHVESWSFSGRRKLIIEGTGHGIQLFPAEDSVFVHVLQRANLIAGTHSRSTLLELRDSELVRVAGFDHGVLFSMNRAGRFLCRDTGDAKGQRQDAAIDPDGQVLPLGNLGHYDCFNHYLRIDGVDHLYFLRGTPASSYQSKVLCRIESSGFVKECMWWDSNEQHLMSGNACLLPSGTLARSYRVHDPKPERSRTYVDAYEMQSGRGLWRREVSGLVTCFTSVEGQPWLIFALTDGKIGVVDVRTGALVFEMHLQVDGVSTVALSMCALGQSIAVGTIDGRLLLLRIESLRP